MADNNNTITNWCTEHNGACPYKDAHVEALCTYYEGSTLSSLLLASVGVLLALEAYEEADDALDKEYEILDRQTIMAEWFNDHYVANQIPQIEFALNTALGYAAIAPNYGTIYAGMADMAARQKAGGDAFVQSYAGENCLSHRPEYRGSSLSYASMSAAVSEESRAAEAVFDGTSEVKKNALVGAYAGSIDDPGEIFGLMNDAARAVAGIRIAAMGVFNDALRTFGVGVGGLMGNIAGQGGG